MQAPSAACHCSYGAQTVGLALYAALVWRPCSRLSRVCVPVWLLTRLHGRDRLRRFMPQCVPEQISNIVQHKRRRVMLDVLVEIAIACLCELCRRSAPQVCLAMCSEHHAKLMGGGWRHLFFSIVASGRRPCGGEGASATGPHCTAKQGKPSTTPPRTPPSADWVVSPLNAFCASVRNITHPGEESCAIVRCRLLWKVTNPINLMTCSLRDPPGALLPSARAQSTTHRSAGTFVEENPINLDASIGVSGTTAEKCRGPGSMHIVVTTF